MKGAVLIWVLGVFLVAVLFFTYGGLGDRELSLENVSPPPAAAPPPKPEEPAGAEEPELEKISKEVSKLKTAVSSLLSPPPEEKPPPPPAVKSSDLYQKALGALVNIFCDDEAGHRYILGSGAIISPAGYVLTNAHLAEYFLQERVDCVLRRGSPARTFAKAAVLYLPDQNLKIGETQIAQKDLAILKITGPSGTIPLQESFDYFEFSPDYELGAGEVLYSLGYPTEFLGAELILKGANILFTTGTVTELADVDGNFSTAEGANLKGEISAQHGSSGGIFLESKTGKVAGLFVGLTEGKTTAERSQFIFLSSYLDEVVRQDKGMGLLEFLNTNP